MPTELTVLGAPARLERHLGRGATGDVWLARSADGAAFVLKFARDRAAHARLADEGQRLLGVDSPRCVRLLGAGRLGAEVPWESAGARGRLPRGTPFLVLEHSEGETLDPERPRSSADRRALALVVARDIGRALSDLHASGVAHGDVKPANVLLTRSEAFATAKLMDFGLAAASDEGVARGGTRRYLPPEAFDQGSSGDARLRDLFALGLTIAETLDPELMRAERPLEALFSKQLEADVGELVRALTSRAPAVRPSADWVSRRSLELLGEMEPEPVLRERRSGAVRRTYLAQRRSELLAAARDPRSRVDLRAPVGDWMQAALDVARAVEELRGSLSGAGPFVLSDLDAVGRARWLVALVGASAAAWSDFPVAGDAELATHLLRAVHGVEPHSLTLGALEAEITPASAPSTDSVELALLLGRGAPSQATLDAAERRVRDEPASVALSLALGRAFRLRGQLGRALAVLGRVAGPAARVEAAEVLRRAGDAPAARALLDALSGEASGAVAEQARTVRARMALDAGDPGGALAFLEQADATAFALEVRALAELALGRRREAQLALERARLHAQSDEERGRIEAVAGNLLHFEGQLDRALEHFRRAAEHAARAGAVLEEATYLTGVSAAASNAGELGLALSAARRALLLFESLGRAREAGRALLSLASVHAAVGARIEARDHAVAASQRAKAAGDRRCRGYAHIVLADIAPLHDNEGVEHARFAESLLDGDADDVLRVKARLHERGEEVGIDQSDAQAFAADRALDARLEWWTARARVASSAAVPHAPDRVLEALLGFGEAGAPSVVRGPAFAAGAELAARLGDGDRVRRLTLAAGEAAREVVRRSGTELLALVRLLPWVRLADSAQSGAFSPEQLADVDRLVRALARRDRLRPLLEQVLDALVLWTGVERGLLLLRAPQGKLKARAARNLLRSDLSGAQLELSHSLAERALAQGEPVVAVDAAGDLPEMHESVHALKLRSVLAVPLIARGEALGVVYLDDRVRRGAFGPRELSWVRLVATLAAVAIQDARDQILLRRAARRARRAEARVESALARREAELDVVERELARTREARETRFRYDDIVGQSEALRGMLRLVDRVAMAQVPVLLIGESGSGKELVARAIHRHSPRSSKAFVAENCGAIPETLLESALFGHVRGAFTGAARPRAGLFEVADGGSLFLDEIGEMSLGMQAKLLRVLQDGEIRPVGSERARNVDVRVIGATHRDLTAMVAAGKFREDLYYRLNVISVRIPSLRERIGDIPLLVKHFLAVHAPDRRVQVAKAALDKLSAYPWPGNVRQLENEVRRALVLSDGVVGLEHLTADVLSRGESKSMDELNLRQRVDALEAELVRIALRRTEGNQTRAAELLGVSRFGLQKMMKRLEISVSAFSA